MKDEYINQIEKTLEKMSSKEFIVRDLFVGALFDDIPEQERMQIGREFLNYSIAHSDTIEIKKENKTDLNQQIYKRR